MQHFQAAGFSEVSLGSQLHLEDPQQIACTLRGSSTNRIYTELFVISCNRIKVSGEKQISVN